MIIQVEKGEHIVDYCTLCERECDEGCKKCKDYNGMFSQDICGVTYYHGYQGGIKKHDSI